MKRSLSMLLAVFMVLSLAFVGVVSATADVPDGFTGINSLSQITDPAGSYYLTADIGDAENPNTTTFESFSGTIDGGDRTIYTSVPLVAALNGATIKNVTIAGNVSISDNASGWLGKGSFANSSNGLTLTNVTNNINLSVEIGSSTRTAFGMIGLINGNCTFTNCANNGNVTISGGAGGFEAGGFIGRFTNNVSATFSKCVNNGAVTSTSTAGTQLMGGFIGAAYTTATVSFDQCENRNAISTTSTTAGGGKGAGFIGLFSSAGTANLEKCVNSGNVTMPSIVGGFLADMRGKAILDSCINTGNMKCTFTSGQILNGGLVGIMQNYNAGGHSFTECINTGNVTSTCGANTQTVSGGIVGRVAGGTFTVSKCANYGTILSTNTNTTKQEKAGGIVGVGNNAATFTDCANYGSVTANYCVGGIIGEYAVTAGTYTRCADFGSVSGTNASYVASIIGLMKVKNTDAAKMITLTDCYGSLIYGAGMYTTTSTDEYGNLKTVYTVEGVTTTVIGTNDGEGTNSSITITTSAWRDYSNFYNAGYQANGQHTAEKMRGANAAKSCAGLNFGSGTWILREGYPELAVAETLLGKTADPTGDYTVTLEGQQQSLAVGETYALRFVSSVKSTTYDYVGVEVLVATSGNATVKTAGEKKSASVWEQILASADGVNSAYPAEPAVGTYYSALTLTDIPTTGTYTFIVTPYTEKDGAKTNGATAAIVYKDGALVTSYWFAAPAR